MQHPATPIQLTRFPVRPRKQRLETYGVAGALALAPEQASGAPPGRGPGLRVVGGAEPPEVARIVRLVVEALVGARAPRQLATWVTPEVAWALSRPRPTAQDRRLRSAPRVLTWRVQYPGARIAEVSALAEVGGRIHAVALRLEPMRGRWRCAAIETTIPV